MTTTSQFTLSERNGLVYKPHPRFLAQNLRKKVRLIHESLRYVCFVLYGVMRNLDAIISVSNYVRLNPGLQRARPLWSGTSDKLIMHIRLAERKVMLPSMAEVVRKLFSNI